MTSYVERKPKKNFPHFEPFLVEKVMKENLESYAKKMTKIFFYCDILDFLLIIL